MKVGVIGLGAMGSKMALNFHYAGFLHMVWNRTREKTVALAEKTKVRIADTPQQLASECELIVTCVPRDADVLAAVRAIAATIRPDTVVADTSTVNAETARQAASILKDREAHFLDCPVSGGVEGAKKGTLAIMAGGDEKILDRIKPALSSIASNIAYIGPTGSGQACKAVNQLMAAGINQAVTEALAFGEAMGLDMNKVVDIIATGAAGNAAARLEPFVTKTGIYAYGFFPDLEDLFERQAKELDRKQREALLHQLQKAVAERVLTAPIFQQAFLCGVGSRVEEAGAGLIQGYPYSAPPEDLKLKP